jgi:hypothetical protein
MSVATDTSPQLTIAGYTVASLERAGGMLSLRIGLHGGTLADLVRALGRLDGVRVTSGPEADGRERCYIAQCPGFKLVVSSPANEAGEFALALVSRAPQAALSVMSDLGATLERLMSVPWPPRLPDLVSKATPRQPFARKTASLSPGQPFARKTASLSPRKPLARKTALQRKTPLARGRFR